jgi:hypothetical protein
LAGLSGPAAHGCRWPENFMRLKISICALLCFLSLDPSAWCKRGGAPIVGPVIYEGIKYIAPNDDGFRGYIQAWDMKTKKKIWELTIFTNSIQPELEKDVQWVFIQELKLERSNMIITDERDRHFLLDLKTIQIKKLQR